MKLKYHYDLESWANDTAYDSRSSITRTIDDCTVEFLFDDTHNLCGINVFVPNAEVVYDDSGRVITDGAKDAQAYLIANYVSDVLQSQTGKCAIVESQNTPDYIPESEKEVKELAGKTFRKTSTISSTASIRGPCNLSVSGLNKYANQKDAFSIYMDAKRMINPIGKYREFFRVLDHFFPFEGSEFDTRVSDYLQKLNAKYTTGLIEQLRKLRNRCSHAKSGASYIAPYNLEGVREVGASLGTIEEIAKLLIENPPP